jgi:branched-chain amino acid transport system substrate-binding protein
MLANLRSTNPDMIFAVSYVMDASMIVKQMKELDFNTKLYVGGGAGYTMPEFAQNAGPASEYIASTTLWVPNVAWPGASDYFNKYKQKYGKEPDYHGAQAYATMYVIADALGRAKDLTNTGIQQALKQTDIKTIMGPIKFEDWEGYTNQNKPNTYVVQWQKGKLEVVWPENVKSASYVYPVPKWNER